MLRHIADQESNENSMEGDISERDKQTFIDFIGSIVGEAYLSAEDRESRIRPILELIQ